MLLTDSTSQVVSLHGQGCPRLPPIATRCCHRPGKSATGPHHLGSELLRSLAQDLRIQNIRRATCPRHSCRSELVRSLLHPALRLGQQTSNSLSQSTQRSLSRYRLWDCAMCRRWRTGETHRPSRDPRRHWFGHVVRSESREEGSPAQFDGGSSSEPEFVSEWTDEEGPAFVPMTLNKVDDHYELASRDW